MSIAQTPSKLDFEQCIQGAYDDATSRLRVETELATVNIGGSQEILITDDVDAIKIGDGNHQYLAINPDGSINVNATVTPGSTAKDYGASAQALRTASQIGNAAGQADFGLGAPSAQTLRVVSDTADGAGNSITSAASNSNRLLHTQSPDTFTSTQNLTSLGSEIVVNMQGLTTVGFQINAGTLIGTITAMASIDGGFNYTVVPFYDPANSAVLPSLSYSGGTNPLQIVSIVPIGGCSHVKVRITSYTSGSTTALLRASNVTGAAGAVTASAFNNVVNSFVSIPANTPTLALAANVNRKYAYLSNSSGSTARLQFKTGTGLTANTGLPIPSQDYFELKGDNLFTGDVYIYCSSNITLSISEGTPT